MGGCSVLPFGGCGILSTGSLDKQAEHPFVHAGCPSKSKAPRGMLGKTRITSGKAFQTASSNSLCAVAAESGLSQL